MKDRDNRWGIDPYYLLYLLSHTFTQGQMYQKVFLETTLPNIGGRWQELELPYATDPDVRRQVSERVRDAVQSKWRALMDLNELREEFGDITT